MAAEEQFDRTSDGCQHVVVLVHGTFARGASWTHQDSPLATTVARALGKNVLLTSFEWTGRNTHADRLSGGAELAECVRLLRRCHPTASLHIVAHSHGGNVVAYALRAPDIRGSVRSVACLGTPFIVAHPRNLRPTFRLLTFISSTTRVLLALFVALVGGGVGTLMVYVPEFTSFITGALLLLLVVALCLFAMRVLARLDRYVATKVAPGLKEMQDTIVASLQGQFEEVPVLNVQTRRDEAAGYLHFVDFVSRIPFRVWSPTAVLWIVTTVTVIYVLGMAWVTVQSDDWRLAWTEALLGLVAGYLIYLLIIVVILAIVTLIAWGLCAIWPKIFRGHALGFGEDGFMKNWIVSISASRQPPHADHCHDEPLDVRGPGLHHSLLYQDARAIDAIARWLTAWAKDREAPPNRSMQPTR